MSLAASISASFGPTPRTYMMGVSRPGTIRMLKHPPHHRVAMRPVPQTAGRIQCKIRRLSHIRCVDRHLGFNRLGQSEFGFGEVVHLLKVEPELRAIVEEAGKAQSRVGSDGSLASNNLTDARGRHANDHG